MTDLIFRLLKDRELSGYELAGALRQASLIFRNKGELHLYPALHELERRGFLISRWVSGNKVETKYYRLSVLGEYYLESHKQLPPLEYLRARIKQYICRTI